MPVAHPREVPHHRPYAIGRGGNDGRTEPLGWAQALPTRTCPGWGRGTLQLPGQGRPAGREDIRGDDLLVNPLVGGLLVKSPGPDRERLISVGDGDQLHRRPV